MSLKVEKKTECSIFEKKKKKKKNDTRFTFSIQ